MNKQQIACKAVLEWDEVAEEARFRMTKALKQNGAISSNERGRTAEILAKKFNVSKGYVAKARKLFLEDYEQFEKVLRGEEPLPGNMPRRKDGVGNPSFALYRVYDKESKLLYIGKTWSVGQRMKDHSGHSQWWDEFSTMSVDRNFSSYEELTRAETLAIRKEKPFYNLKAKWYQ